jgi:DNA-binding response OmpR family regulator
MRILVVEDEDTLRDGLVDLLRGAGHQVTAVADGLTAAELGTTEAFDLILLDLMLPKLDGMEVCRRLKTARPAQTIIMLTAKGGEEDKVRGLRLGADDYVTKPFGAKELLARVEAAERRLRNTPSEKEVLVIGDLELDLGKCEGRRAGAEFHLTAREAGMLRWLYRHRERAVSRAELLEQVWGVPGHLETRTVDMAIANLRQKIEADPGKPVIIQSVKGVGYIWGAGAVT